MISESVFPSSGKRWGTMLARHVLNMHGRSRNGKENIALKAPTVRDVAALARTASKGGEDARQNGCRASLEHGHNGGKGNGGDLRGIHSD